MPIIIAILGFSLLIVVHELGHFIAARLVGMRVIKFSIGFGPAIVRVKGKETIYQLAAFPIGGYVQVAGLGAASEGEEFQVFERGEQWLKDGARNYEARPLWQRALFVGAGPGFNFVFAVLLFAGLFAAGLAVTTDFKRTASLVVKEVAADKPAALAGLLPGDVIERIDGEPVRTFAALKRKVGASEGRPLRLTVARSPDGAPVPLSRKVREDDGLVLMWPDPPESWTRVELSIAPEETDRGYLLGLSPEPIRFAADGASDALTLGARETWVVTAATFGALRKWLAGSDEAQLGSVVKITKIGADTVKMGSEWFLTLMAVLSVNLGLLNMLPVPGLDGGRMMFILVEAVARRPVPPRFEVAIHAVGLLFLFGLVAVVVARDVAEIFF